MFIVVAMGVSPCDPKALQGTLEPLAERRPGRGGANGIEDPLDRLPVLARAGSASPRRPPHAQVRRRWRRPGRELGPGHRDERRLTRRTGPPAKASVAERPALERSKSQSPGENVAVLLELAGVEKSLIREPLRRHPRPAAIPERAAAKRPRGVARERREDGLEGNGPRARARPSHPRVAECSTGSTAARASEAEADEVTTSVARRDTSPRVGLSSAPTPGRGEY